MNYVFRSHFWFDIYGIISVFSLPKTKINQKILYSNTKNLNHFFWEHCNIPVLVNFSACPPTPLSSSPCYIDDPLLPTGPCSSIERNRKKKKKRMNLQYHHTTSHEILPHTNPTNHNEWEICKYIVLKNSLINIIQGPLQALELKEFREINLFI